MNEHFCYPACSVALQIWVILLGVYASLVLIVSTREQRVYCFPSVYLLVKCLVTSFTDF